MLASVNNFVRVTHENIYLHTYVGTLSVHSFIPREKTNLVYVCSTYKVRSTQILFFVKLATHICHLELILRLTNLQLPKQRQRCLKLNHFFKVEDNICFKNALGYSWRCDFLQRWRCR
jgi:hypothetical protein